MTEEVKGIDTILTPNCKYPMSTGITFDQMYIGQRVLEVWNGLGLSFIPYCTTCKVPVVWIRGDTADSRILRCPDCSRVWCRDENWKTKDAKLLKRR